MSTFLFDKIIFGPVHSRRLGVSLGVNLLPINKKICTYDCIYCECGFNGDHATAIPQMPKREDVSRELEEVLRDMKAKAKAPNVITFAGNGEPTIHKDFAAIIDDTIALRDIYSPDARIAVLSNATMTHKPSVFEALKKVDDNILKLDSGLEETIRLLDRPQGAFTLDGLVDNLRRFEGQLTIQTMFVRGLFDGKEVDNTTNEDVAAWLKLLKDIGPKSVMIYTIERDTPVEGLVKVPLQVLKQIAQRVEEIGIPAQVSG